MDITEKLEQVAEHKIDILAKALVCYEAKVEIERLRAALKPFADVAAAYERSHEITAQHYRDERGPDYKYPPPPDSHRIDVPLGDCRKARIVVEQIGTDK